MNAERILEGQVIALSEANNQMSVAIARSRLSPQRLEEEYLKAEKRVAYHMAKGLDWYIRAGTLLCILKEKVGHGNWEPFLDRVGLTQRTARRRMDLAIYITALPDMNPDTDEPWTYTDALAVIKGLRNQTNVDIALNDLKSLETLEDLEVESIADLVPKKKRARMSANKRLSQKINRVLVEIRQEADTDPSMADVITHAITELESMLDAMPEDIE